MIRVSGYLRNRKEGVNVHGIIFTFYEPKARDKSAVKEKTREVYDEFRGIFGNEKVEEDEAVDQVAADEAKGIGFYYIQVLVNDQIWGKTSHRRFGFIWKVLSSVVRRFLP